ncbi:hypothetical protein METBIDRAFT_85370 [Metschnikowia bicuspidata var. bicuspidata NRRL YB-4993]|uniref:Uncharacterized protein n=1 Tax=Metschnikowia bicuspidata var. bicuspidata NRRL YB-4993 TaxID=869754 RepID=A0A1A0HGR1_9ASCO|nr:hypothetical protein METBIDRAFT_85370 [Metschnikowia bicuspidata var. bicuspidata NRRL YB-4993]OBA23043.1 hypothetical protein METBIDRAFT_85370 [Metschnikowia bicuspidata var. bicuspidata NRRL YB-4993]
MPNTNPTRSSKYWKHSNKNYVASTHAGAAIFLTAYLLCFFKTITWNLSKSDKEALFCLMAAFLAAGVAANLASMSAAAHFLVTTPVLAPLGNFGKTTGVKVTLAKAIAYTLHTLFWSMISTMVANLEPSTKTTRPNSTNLQLAVLTVLKKD